MEKSTKLEVEELRLPSPVSNGPTWDRKSRFSTLTKASIALLALVGAGILHLYARNCDVSSQGVAYAWNYSGQAATRRPGKGICPQVEELSPSENKDLWEEIGTLLDTHSFTKQAVDWLAGAVAIPTEVFDGMGSVDEDPRWLEFVPFHKYLLNQFPNVNSSLKLTKVNTYGLLYEWKGSDDSLKPILLAAHQDVVPVEPETWSQWEYPPFSGHDDGDKIWGRGSSDDKNGLIGILAAFETLLEYGFQPARTIVLASGFDEEISGTRGAQTLSEHLLRDYGENSFAMLVDEGGGYAESFGSQFALVGTGEKGMMDARIEVTAPGGHSSLPPDHTGIGMLSSMVVEFEDNPFPVALDRDSPVYSFLQCQAEYAEDIDHGLRNLIFDSMESDRALERLEEVASGNLLLASLIRTTQAATVVSGGVKSNALPELASAIINHRIATQSSVDEVEKYDTNRLHHLAERFNLSYTAFGHEVHTGPGQKIGTLTLGDAFGTALEPAPVSPTDDAAYKILSGSIKATYYAHRGQQIDEELYVTPGILTGNTDTKWYWKLTESIFRYNHVRARSGDTLGNNIHTVNEFIQIDSFVEMIRFFTTLILNADESTEMRREDY